MDSIAQILLNIKEKNTGKYISKEWQLYGYNLAKYLDELDRVSLYIRLAKNEDRVILQRAWDFVKDSNPRQKSRLFLWKLKQLKNEKNDKLKS